REDPPHLRTALGQLKQLRLPLEEARNPPSQKVLLIDDDWTRLMARRKLFWEKKIDTTIAATIIEGLDHLENGGFRLVIVDYRPTTEEENAALRIVQEFNL